MLKRKLLKGKTDPSFGLTVMIRNGFLNPFTFLVITVRTETKKLIRRVVIMVYEVDFSIQINKTFHTIHKAFIFAVSVSECQVKAESIRDELIQSKNHHVHIFIEA